MEVAASTRRERKLFCLVFLDARRCSLTEKEREREKAVGLLTGSFFPGDAKQNKIFSTRQIKKINNRKAYAYYFASISRRNTRDQCESISQSILRRDPIVTRLYLYAYIWQSPRKRKRERGILECVNDILTAPFISQRAAVRNVRNMYIRCVPTLPLVPAAPIEKGRVTTPAAVYDPVSFLAALGKARSGSLSPATMGQ